MGYLSFIGLTNQIQELKNTQNKRQDKPVEIKSMTSGSNLTNEERNSFEIC